jgi:hypothetical protein
LDQGERLAAVTPGADNAQTPTALVRLFTKIERHLHVRPGSDVSLDEFTSGFSAAWPGDGVHIVLDSRGNKLLEELYREAIALQGPSLRWQLGTMRARVHAALDALAHGRVLPAVAASLIVGWSQTTPEERIVLVDVHGLSIEAPLAVAGVTFYPIQARRRLEDDYFMRDVDDFLVRPVHSAAARPNDACAEVRIRAEDEMAANNARLRVLIALCVVRQSLRTNETLEQQMEYTAGIERTDHTSFVAGVPGTNPQSFGWGDVVPQPLRFNEPGLARARMREGIRALETLSSCLPDVPLGTRVERVLRAAQLLGRSMDGDGDDRFLRRWTALEALVGSPSDNTTQEIATRAARVLEPLETRPSRERWFKQASR